MNKGGVYVKSQGNFMKAKIDRERAKAKPKKGKEVIRNDGKKK
jgi:hypothetical protein